MKRKKKHEGTTPKAQSQKIPSRTEIEKLLIERIETDFEFRDRLRTNSHNALSDVLGMNLPTEIKVSVHEESRSELHIVIPGKGNNTPQ